MLINLVSDSEYSSKDHGVHTAYLSYAQMIEETGNKVIKNSSKTADIVHIHTIGPLGFFKLLTGKKVVVTAHLIPDSFVGSLVGAKYWYGLSKRYLKFFYNKADLVLAVSPKVEEELIKMGVTKEKVRLFPNPINSEHFKKNQTLRDEKRKELKIRDDEFVVLGAGQMQTRKGISDFIETARKLPELKFVWVGGQPFKNLTEIDEKLREDLKNQPDNLIFAGVFGYAQMPALYNAADVFLLPSYQENAPMAIIEAASCGLPIVLRNLPEYKQLYKKGYVEADSKGFEQVIKKLYEDKNYYLEKHKEALELAKEFSFEKMGKILIGFYNSLLN